jgi:hypothetical protein
MSAPASSRARRPDRTALTLIALAPLALAVASCTGGIDGGPSGGATSRIDPVDTRLPARVWRLSSAQLDAEVDRLFGDGAPAIGLPAAAGEHGIDNIAANAGIDDGNASQLIDGARGVATWVVANGPEASRCGATWGTDACIDSFLAWFPESAYRRPVTTDESGELRTLYTDLLPDYDSDFAFAAVVRAVLMSPDFLYRTELGPEATPLAAGARTTLTGDEIATLLAFALTDTSPDDELMAAGASGALTSPDAREAQVRRLIAGSGPIWRQFFWQWLHMDTLRSQGVEVGLDTVIVDQMEEEYGAYLDDVIVANDGTFEDVFSAQYSFVRPELAAHYGVTHPGGGLARVELDPTQRGGLLTLGAWLVSHGKRGRDNVVRRGMNVYRDAMCNEIVPPPGLDVTAAQAALVMNPDPTVREGVEARGSSGTCSLCHHVADPVGLAFENYTSDGRWQTMYPDGRPVEPMVTLQGVGTFDDAPALSLALTQSRAFRNCFIRRFATFVVGRDVGAPGAVVWLSEASTSFEAHDDQLTELLIALVRHPAFIERQN